MLRRHALYPLSQAANSTHLELNQGTLGLRPNALPLSYVYIKILIFGQRGFRSLYLNVANVTLFQLSWSPFLAPPLITTVALLKGGESTAAGLEPAREYPNGFQVRLLNHSDKPPFASFFWLSLY